jgi:hypothetical protein
VTIRRALFGVFALLLVLAIIWRLKPAPSAAADVIGRAEIAPDVCPSSPPATVDAASYPSLLRMMAEPWLDCGPFAEDEVYRVVFRDRAAGGAGGPGAATAPPLSVRLARSENVQILVARQYLWTADDTPERPLPVTASRVRPMTPDEWRALETAVQDAGFWEMPVDDHGEGQGGRPGLPPGEAPGEAKTGGPRWQIEGRRGRGYHQVRRAAAEQGPFAVLTRHLLSVAGFSSVAGFEGQRP